MEMMRSVSNRKLVIIQLSRSIHPVHNCVDAVYYLAKDETLVATTAKHRLRKITLNIESRKSLKHAERID